MSASWSSLRTSIKVGIHGDIIFENGMFRRGAYVNIHFRTILKIYYQYLGCWIITAVVDDFSITYSTSKNGWYILVYCVSYVLCAENGD